MRTASLKKELDRLKEKARIASTNCVFIVDNKDFDPKQFREEDVVVRLCLEALTD